MQRKLFISLTSIIITVLTGVLLLSCRNNRLENMIILTEMPGDLKDADYGAGDSWRYITRGRIVTLNPEKPASVKLLTGGFYSACSPDISDDGTKMLFAAQQNQDESWQIWEMELGNLKCRKITSFKEDSTDPVYLPGGRLVFSKLTVNDTVKTAHCLYSCNSDGTGLRQITFSPVTNLAVSVLKDGRLLTVTKQLIPDERDPQLTVLRPDGTKAAMFYRTVEGGSLISSACETADRKIVFVESDNKSLLSGNVVSVNYNRPLYTRVNLTSGIIGGFHSVLPLTPDKYLVSYRRSDSENLALYELDPFTKSLGKALFTDPDYNVMEAVLVEKYERPKRLPSEVDMQVKTGLLLCQNINFLNPAMKQNLSVARKAVKIEVLGIDTTYGAVRVMEDGSFYLKVMADIPFRLRILDEKGNVVSGPCSWLWLRPNERRGCIGCHEDPELAPENRLSLAIGKPPVIIPVHISEIKEKVVDLE
jgi:hypothetical protein